MLPDAEWEAEQEAKLIKLVEELSTPDSAESKLNNEEIVRRLKDIYCECPKTGNFYHHDYSKITSLLFDIAQEQVDVKSPYSSVNSIIVKMSEVSSYITFVLLEPLDLIGNESCGSEYSESLYEAVRKLRIHISLEAKRSEILAEVSNEIINSQSKRLGHLESNLNAAESKSNLISGKISSYQKDSITILGIFAGVVLAFNSGVQFSIAGLNASDHSSVLAVAFIVSIVGLFVFNALFTMFTFIFRIIKGSFDPFVLMSRRTFFAINTTLLGFAAILGLTFGVQQSNISILPNENASIFYWIVIAVILIVVTLSIIFAANSRVWEPYRELKYWWKHRKD